MFIKRPLNGYMIWAKKERQHIMNKKLGMNMHKISIVVRVLVGYLLHKIFCFFLFIRVLENTILMFVRPF